MAHKDHKHPSSLMRTVCGNNLKKKPEMPPSEVVYSAWEMEQEMPELATIRGRLYGLALFSLELASDKLLCDALLDYPVSDKRDSMDLSAPDKRLCDAILDYPAWGMEHRMPSKYSAWETEQEAWETEQEMLAFEEYSVSHERELIDLSDWGMGTTLRPYYVDISAWGTEQEKLAFEEYTAWLTQRRSLQPIGDNSEMDNETPQSEVDSVDSAYRWENLRVSDDDSVDFVLSALCDALLDYPVSDKRDSIDLSAPDKRLCDLLIGYSDRKFNIVVPKDDYLILSKKQLKKYLCSDVPRGTTKSRVIRKFNEILMAVPSGLPFAHLSCVEDVFTLEDIVPELFHKLGKKTEFLDTKPKDGLIVAEGKTCSQDV